MKLTKGLEDVLEHHLAVGMEDMYIICGEESEKVFASPIFYLLYLLLIAKKFNLCRFLAEYKPRVEMMMNNYRMLNCCRPSSVDEDGDTLYEDGELRDVASFHYDYVEEYVISILMEYCNSIGSEVMVYSYVDGFAKEPLTKDELLSAGDFEILKKMAGETVWSSWAGSYAGGCMVLILSVPWLYDVFMDKGKSRKKQYDQLYDWFRYLFKHGDYFGVKVSDKYKTVYLAYDFGSTDHQCNSIRHLYLPNMDDIYQYYKKNLLKKSCSKKRASKTLSVVGASK